MSDVGARFRHWQELHRQGHVSGRTIAELEEGSAVLRELLIGTAAGACGTTALNAVTYGDMPVRGRPASSTPSQVAARLAGEAGIDLFAEDEAPDGPTAQNRQSGLGFSRRR
jgi:hypothetical protein